MNTDAQPANPAQAGPKPHRTETQQGRTRSRKASQPLRNASKPEYAYMRKGTEPGSGYFYGTRQDFTDKGDRKGRTGGVSKAYPLKRGRTHGANVSLEHESYSSGRGILYKGNYGGKYSESAPAGALYGDKK